MKKVLLSFALLSTSVIAGTNNWSYSDYSKGSYVPKTGTFLERTYYSSQGGTYESKIEFRFDNTNVSSILDYNNGGNNPGSRCDNANAYVTIDMSADPDATWGEKLHARSVYSNLPNPKVDLESDTLGSSYNEESEVVALGSVNSWTDYKMITYWNDYRSGHNNDGGDILVQFAISKKGFSDYNNCTTAASIQIFNPYSQDYGQL